MAYPYTLSTRSETRIGLIVLQADETIESDFRRLVSEEVRLFVSRVPSGTDVSAASLSEMEKHLSASAALFPRHISFDAVGYGCTSGTAQIGAGNIAQQVRAGTETRAVTEPVSALLAACGHMGIARLAMLSPYVEEVSARLREVFSESGIATPVFGTFAEPTEARVARIDEESVFEAAKQLAEGASVDGVFLSCTNLRTLGVIERLEEELGLPVFSSNQVLAWHMLQLAGIDAAKAAPGMLFAASRRD